MRHKNGFTLVEVLIAAVILFAALAITADLYKASSHSANKIIEKSAYYQQTNRLVSTIKAEINRQTNRKKSLDEIVGVHVSDGIEFQWQAIRISFKSRPQGVEEIDPPQAQFGLYDVTVNALTPSKSLPEISFKVATW